MKKMTSPAPLTETAASTATPLVSVADFCRNLPPAPKQRINRDNLIEEVRRTFEAGVRVVILVGERLAGKTEFAANFVRQRPENSAGLFVDLDSAYARSTSYAQLSLAEQISWLADGVGYSGDAISEGDFARYILKLQRLAKRRPITLVVDGVLQGSEAQSLEASQLMDLLPFGVRELTFIITAASHEQIPKLTKMGIQVRIMELGTVSPDEARGFLSDLISEEKYIQEIRSFCKSILGRMQRVRHMLENGNSVDDLLVKSAESLDVIFDYEWNLTPRTAEADLVFATLTFAARPIGALEISTLTKIQESLVSQILNSSGVVSKQSAKGIDLFSIESNSHRQFIARKLESLKPQVVGARIQFLLSNPSSDEYTVDLPSQLSQPEGIENYWTNLTNNTSFGYLRRSKL